MTDVAPTPTAHPAAKSGSGLGKKLGPLPIWGWAIVIIVGYFLYKFLKDRSAASSATGLAAAGTGAAVNGAGDGSGGTNNVSSTTPVLDATDWISAAETALGNLGYSSDSVDQAFQDYLAGNTLTAQEAAIVESATKLVGPSPLGTPITATTGTPGSTVGTAGGTAGVITTADGIPLSTDASGVFQIPLSQGSAALNALAAAVNTGGTSVQASNGQQTYTVEPGQSIAQAAIAANAPIVAFEQEYGTSPSGWLSAHPGQTLPQVAAPTSNAA
jgi:hypothetical protein